MTINRMAVFVYPSWRHVFDRFQPGTIIIPILVCWVWILAMCALSVIVTPTQRFNHYTLRFEDDGQPLVEAPILVLILGCIDSAIPFVIALLYVSMYYAIRAKRSTQGNEYHSENRGSEERKMLTQALVIAIFLDLYNIIAIASIIVDHDLWV
ncbi:hypothetical protein PENTCL1PPCAC_16200, partial [Pristionchus entomophagus]